MTKNISTSDSIITLGIKDQDDLILKMKDFVFLYSAQCPLVIHILNTAETVKGLFSSSNTVISIGSGCTIVKHSLSLLLPS